MDGVSYFLTGFLRQGNAALARSYLGVSGGGIPDAPVDGTFYGRLNANWVHAPTIQNADATHTGLLTSGDWATFNGKQPAGAYITDAPSDGNTYGRKNGVWSVTPKEFTSAQLTIPTSTPTRFQGSIAHGLGAVPKFVRPVFRCINATGPFSIGDELDWGGWWDSSGPIVWYKIWANTTNINYDTEPNFTLLDMPIVDFDGSSLPMYSIFPAPAWAVVFYASL